MELLRTASAVLFIPMCALIVATTILLGSFYFIVCIFALYGAGDVFPVTSLEVLWFFGGRLLLLAACVVVLFR